MRVLLAGATGAIGRPLLEALRTAGHEVLALTRAAHAKAGGTNPPRRLPGWVIRLAAPYFATLMIDTSMRVSNARAKEELGWTPTLPTYREGIHTLHD